MYSRTKFINLEKVLQIFVKDCIATTTYFHYIILTRNTYLCGWGVRREAKTSSELWIVIFWVGLIQLETLGWAMPQPFFIWMEKGGNV